MRIGAGFTYRLCRLEPRAAYFRGRQIFQTFFIHLRKKNNIRNIFLLIFFSSPSTAGAFNNDDISLMPRDV